MLIVAKEHKSGAIHNHWPLATKFLYDVKINNEVSEKPKQNYDIFIIKQSLAKIHPTCDCGILI